MSSRRTAAVTFFVTLAGILAAGRVAVAQSSAQKPANAQPQQSTPANGNGNEFPGDTTNVPVVSNTGSVLAPDDSASGPPPALPADESDPVRAPEDSPESASSSSTGDSSSSSSLASIDRRVLDPPTDDNGSGSANNPEKQDKKANRVPGILNRHEKPPAEHQETAKEDLSVGEYYLSTHDFKGALSRFQSAMVLDPEEPEVYWGLAEAQRHLGDLASAKANYEKLLEYDPNNKHAKDARKLLKEPELANAQPATAPTQPAATQQ